MFKFWYKFVQHNINLINLNLADRVYDEFIKNSTNEYMGHIFEDMTMQYFNRLIRSRKIDFIPSYYGNYWGTDKNKKEQVEIDWIAVSDNKTIFSECKWKNEKIGKGVLNEL